MQKKPDLGVQFVSSEIVNTEDETSAAIVHSPCWLDRISNSKLEKKTDNFFYSSFFYFFNMELLLNTFLSLNSMVSQVIKKKQAVQRAQFEWTCCKTKIIDADWYELFIHPNFMHF